MKTPEEIKMLLANHKSYTFNAETLFADALAYIQQLEAQGWEVFDLLSSVWYGKGAYFKQNDGTVYSRVSCKYMTFEQAVDELATILAETQEVEG